MTDFESFLPRKRFKEYRAIVDRKFLFLGSRLRRCEPPLPADSHP